MKTANGRIYRRNRKYLRQTSEAPPATSSMEQGAEDEFTSVDQQPNENNQLADNNDLAENQPNQSQQSEQTVTRTGQVSKPLSRLEDYFRH